MIRITNLSKSFVTPESKIPALKNINLEIKKGDIYGIVGFSGAGKSTLIRCLNRLEEPDSGSIYIAGKEITRLNKGDLRQARKKIGMIFQLFNLYDSMTVFKNIAFALEVARYPKAKIKERVGEIIELVGLSDKANAYPAQLSGGQKQRVGIARSLANNPEVLLSDEATSSLDPRTTYSILDLLHEINRKLNLTIVLITHEMDVLKYICRNVAVIEHGEIIETGTIDELFADPQSDTTKLFVNKQRPTSLKEKLILGVSKDAG
ncbi:MAG TPA: ATP-binding cassette domain-containing protein [Desulfosporosinus sp.]|nr:ATP-binding cassette domain-containing protein [Desulfosporosinus sp.]